MSAAVALRAVRHRFDATPVLRDVDLDVAVGERVAIVGANGAGKTTLLAVVAGLLRPDHGQVGVFGGELRDPRIRARIGYVGHQPFLYPRLTVLENLRFWTRMYGCAHGRGLEALASLGLDGEDRRPVSAYSQGMRRRAALACALAHDPGLLLLDEPFAGLDAQGSDAVAGLLRDGGHAVVVATHRVDGLPHVDRILELREGRLR